MGIEIFLALDGIKGESLKSGAEGWIEIFGFSNGASNHSSVAFGTGSGAGKVDLSSISVTKQLDIASPYLFASCCNGSHISTGTLIVREVTGATSPEVYFQYDMLEVFVDSVSWSGAGGGGGKPLESVSISTKALTITYTPQNSDGSLGDKIPKGWNQNTNSQL